MARINKVTSLHSWRYCVKAENSISGREGGEFDLCRHIERVLKIRLGRGEDVFKIATQDINSLRCSRTCQLF